MIAKSLTFLWLFFGFVLIAIGCNGQSPPVRPDSPNVQSIERLTSSARMLAAKGDKKTALKYHKQALQKSRSFGLPEQEAKALVGIASLLRNEDANQSLEYLKSALSIAERLNSHELKADIYLAIADVYKQQENYREALTALESHQKLLDHIFIKSRQLAIEKLKSEEKRRLEHLILITVIIAVTLAAGITTFYISRKNALNKELTSSNQIKDKLFSIIGHDLRGPAGGIMEALDMIDAGILDQEEEKEIIGLLKKQSKSYNETLNSLLQWASTQLNGAQTHKKEFDPKVIMFHSLEVLKGQASQKKIQINMNVPDGLVVTADPDHFEFIFRNILSNAIKFSNEEENIDVNVIEKDKQVILSIADHGIGIPEDKQKLFQTSASSMESTFGTNGEKGTGLGLMLCKEFVIANNGRLWLDSKSGEGTVFHVSLPKAEA